MTHEEGLALWGSILAFLGGLMLVIDAFSPVRHFLHGEGLKRVEWLEAQLTKIPHDPPHQDAPPANDQAALRSAKRSQWLTRGGFILVTVGFLLDLLGKFHIG